MNRFTSFSMKNKTKEEIKAMTFKCPFCGQKMVFIEDDWTDSQKVNGKYHSVREIVFEHELDHLEPCLQSDCQGGALSYYFIESKKDSNRQAIE